MTYYNLSYLRKAKANTIEKIYKKGIPCKDNLCVEVYEHAIVLPCTLAEDGDKWRECMAGVVDQNNTIVPISCTWPFTELSHPIDEENIRCSEKNVVYIGSFRSHWGHFLIDLVPRLWYALECGKDNVDTFVISGEFNGDKEIQIANIREFLELLGILDKIEIVNIPTIFKSVTVPERAYNFGKAVNDSCKNHIFSDRYLSVFNYVVNKVFDNCKEKNAEKVFPKKVFMTRRSNLDCGIELLDSFFENNDYLVFDPAGATLAELILLLNKCEEVAYIGGTLQHNMLFAPMGMNSVAVESRTYISPIQVDIDMMKDIHVTYIGANYSIVKDFWHHTRLYGYTGYFKQYVKDGRRKEPDTFFQSREFLKKNVENYLRSYRLPDVSTFKYFVSDYSGYEIAAYQESILEISHELGISIDIKCSENYDRESIITETSFLLRTLKIPYSKWRENTYGNKYQTFCNLIKYALQKKNTKKFMIYPYGENGLLCKLILKEVFDIDPIVFDNKVCQYNMSVFPLKGIKQIQETNSIVIVTSAKEECIKDIECYCDMKELFGPYTIY